MNQINGRYEIAYKDPRAITERSGGRVESKVFYFEGECENFIPTGICAFRNEKDELLLVHYQDIVQLSPLEIK